MHKRMLFVCSALLVFALAVNCGGGETTSNLPPAPVGGGAPTFDMATANAGVTGKIVFEGTPPTPAKIQMTADPYCASHSTNAVSEEVVVNDGGLDNVIVYVKSGLPAATFPTPTETVMIDQKDCHYTPHVLTMQVNQPMKIRNSDATLHNIHAWAEKNTPFNEGQAVQNMESTKTFTMEEMPLPIRCDVHKWMGAFVGVFSHPFHTVSKGGGTYSLKLPPGTYEIVAWHEKYGEQTQTVQVADNEQKVDVNFTFKGEGSAAD
jgi:plastocyanin